MSFYADYIKEKTNDHIIEDDIGFVTYRYLEEKHTVYIANIYVAPDFRKSGHASKLADMVVEEAKEKGCNKLLGGVIPSVKDSTTNLKVLIGYGMTLDSSANDYIIFKKDI